jgi:hypothetical protein
MLSNRNQANKATPVSSGARAWIVPVLIGLAIGGVIALVRMIGNQTEDRDNQQRLETNSKAVDEVVRQQSGPSGTSDRERDQLGAVSAVMYFMAKIEVDKLAEAYESTAPSFRKRTALAAFEELVRKHPAVKQSDRRIVRVKISYADGSGASVQLGKAVPGNGDTPVVEISVVKQSQWVVTDFTIRARGDQ